MNESQSNQILTCIVDGMRPDRPPAIRGAAARALINSLDFTRSNFETQQERDVIMQVRLDWVGGRVWGSPLPRAWWVGLGCRGHHAVRVFSRFCGDGGVCAVSECSAVAAPRQRPALWRKHLAW